MRALVVDDSRFIRNYLHSLFAEHGVECLEAADGEQGLNCLRHLGPSPLPSSTGICPSCPASRCSRPPARSCLRATKIVMVTTEAENDHIEAALDAGADEYLVKPFDEAGLFDKLRMAGVDEP